MKFKYFIIAALLILLSASLFAQEAAKTEQVSAPAEKTQTAASAKNIVSISFVGNNNINTEALNNAISSKVGDTYDNAKVQQDIDSIIAMGLFSAVTHTEEDRAGGIALTFHLTENQKINKIVILNSDPLTPEEVISVVKTKEGLIYNENTIRSDFQAIRELYAEKGYLAYVTEDADLTADGVLSIPILVYKVGKITVSGNKKTKTYVILREMQLKSGDYYNVLTLRNKDYPRIYDLGFFETINDPEPEEGEEQGTLNINIPVVEKNTGSFNIGIGYSSTKKLVGTIRVGDTNFLGSGQAVSATWEQGTKKGFKGKGSWEINYDNPWIDKHNTDLNVAVYNKLVYRFSKGAFGSSALDSDVDYGERHNGAIISLSRPFGKEKQTSVMLGFKYDNVETNPNLLAEKELWKIIQNGAITAVNLSVDNDTRDLKSNPKSGSYKSLSFEFGKVKGSEYAPTDYDSTFYKKTMEGKYWKSVGEYRYFIPIQKRKDSDLAVLKDMRSVLCFRVRGGISGGDTPFFEQFFLGGTDTLRGYDDDRFWGKYMLSSTVEYRKPIFDYLTLVAFVDYGSAWGDGKFQTFKDLTQSKSFKGHLGYGLGGRFNTPLGAMRLDWGIGKEGNKLHFSMGHSF